MKNDQVTLDLFSQPPGLPEGIRLRDAGVKKVSSKNSDWLRHAQMMAKMIVSKKGSVCSDDIHAVCPPPSSAHPNVMGAVFRGLGLKVVGFKQTTRPSGHGRMIKVYG